MAFFQAQRGNPHCQGLLSLTWHFRESSHVCHYWQREGISTLFFSRAGLREGALPLPVRETLTFWWVGCWNPLWPRNLPVSPEPEILGHFEPLGAALPQGLPWTPYWGGGQEVGAYWVSLRRVLSRTLHMHHLHPPVEQVPSSLCYQGGS